MNRAQWELQAIARRNGWRSVEGELERRARDRRTARLAADFERERRLGDRRAADRLASDRAAVAAWIARFDAARRK